MWMYARLGSSGKNSGPRGGKYETAKTTTPWPPIQALARSPYITIIPRHPVILDSFEPLTQLPDEPDLRAKHG